MKKLITIMMVLLIAVSCKEESNPLNKIKEAADGVKEVKQGIGNINELVKGAEGLEKNIKELKELTPITKEEIKAWMPEEVDDLSRSAFNIGSQMGISSFKLTFKGDDKKKINITISDGAGNGAGIVSMYLMMQNMEIDKEDESGYERTQTFDGQATLIKYQKSAKYEKSKLQCLVDKRFGIEANAWDMKPEELWSYIKKLEIEKLSN